MNLDVSHILESSLALAIGGAVLKAMDKLCKRCCSEELQEIQAPLPPPRQSPEEEDDDEMTHNLSFNSEAAFRLPHYDNNNQSPTEK